MGLDASVRCHCWRDGKTTRPPFPREWCEIDADDELSLQSEYDSDERWMTLHRWRQDCCPHPGMRLVQERIGNVAGMGQLRAALRDAGSERFAVLLREIPRANGGRTDAATAALALAELDRFDQAGQIGELTALVDSSTGTVLRERVADSDGIFYWGGSTGIDVGLSETNLFVRGRTTGETLFQARRLRQSGLDGRPPRAEAKAVLWEDLDTGRRFESGFVLTHDEYPADGSVLRRCVTAAHVEKRPRLATDFAFMTAALRKVFTASVESGNPVRWS